MILHDPSEAVESSRIMPLLGEMFEVVEVLEYGGTVLHLVFADIAHNFLSEDQSTQSFLALCFDIEDHLLESKDIPSDFVIAMCKKKM